MQDPLSFTFCWGETFDTAPYKGVTRKSCGIASSDLVRAASGGTYDDEREVRDGLTSEKRLSITGEQL